MRDIFHTVFSFSHCSHINPHLTTPSLLIIATMFEAPSRDCHSLVRYTQQRPPSSSHIVSHSPTPPHLVVASAFKPSSRHRHCLAGNVQQRPPSSPHTLPHLPTPPQLIVASAFKPPSRDRHRLAGHILSYPTLPPLTLSHTSAPHRSRDVQAPLSQSPPPCEQRPAASPLGRASAALAVAPPPSGTPSRLPSSQR